MSPAAPNRARFTALARECGFALSGIAPVSPGEDYTTYEDWVAAGLAGPLGYLTDHRGALRADPRQLLPSARSILCLGMLYNTVATQDTSAESALAEQAHDAERAPHVGRTTRSAPDHQVRLRQPIDPPRNLAAPPRGAGSQPAVSRLVSTLPERSGLVSRYAWGSGDYHDVLRNALETLVERLKAEWGDFEYRICVDTAPLLERSYAQLAGLGWIGRNTCLINEPLGSWFFLGEILISLELPADTPPPDRCGTCRRCIDACPTQALVEENGRWQLDAARCISTLTIEQRGETPAALRAATGHLVFGCDICQEVCPWNRRAPVTDEPAFQPLHAALDLEEAAAITAEEFRARFRGTALWRTKYTGLLRNACTAMGNSKQVRFIEQLSRLAESADPGVAAHARWALAQLENLE